MLYAPGLRFGEPRVMAILAPWVGFCFLIRGFTHRQVVEPVFAPFSSRRIPLDQRPKIFAGFDVRA